MHILSQTHRQDSEQSSLYEAFQTLVFKEIHKENRPKQSHQPPIWIRHCLTNSIMSLKQLFEYMRQKTQKEVNTRAFLKRREILIWRRGNFTLQIHTWIFKIGLWEAFSIDFTLLPLKSNHLRIFHHHNKDFILRTLWTFYRQRVTPYGRDFPVPWKLRTGSVRQVIYSQVISNYKWITALFSLNNWNVASANVLQGFDSVSRPNILF